jgi:hypothetical protein
VALPNAPSVRQAPSNHSRVNASACLVLLVGLQTLLVCLSAWNVLQVNIPVFQVLSIVLNVAQGRFKVLLEEFLAPTVPKAEAIMHSRARFALSVWLESFRLPLRNLLAINVLRAGFSL